MRRTGAALLVGGAALATYLTALANGFVWDDILIIEKQLGRFSGPLAPFFPPAVPQASAFYYRPLVNVSYLMDQALGGGAAFHVTPVALHVAASVLLFLLFDALLGPARRLAALVGALVFAVHPVHVEVVAWMAGRAESLAAIGIFTALLAWGGWLETRRSWLLVAGAVALVFGLFGKETAIAGVPLAASLPWVWPSPRARERPLALWLVLAAATAAYLGLRALTLGTAAGLTRPTPLADSARDAFAALGFYARQLVWPTTTAPVLTSVPVDATRIAVGVAAVVGLGAALALALRARARLAVWALAWIAFGLVPPLVLVVRAISETPIADRYLYVPSAGAALLIALAAARLPARWRLPGVALAALTLVAAGALAARRSLVWRDNLTFWENAVAATPDEGFALSKLGHELSERGDRAGAETRYREALAARVSPWQRAVIENNLGHLLLGARRCAEAEPLFRAALTTGPRFPGPYRGLAECLMMRTPASDTAGLAEIRTLLESTVRLDPANARAAFLLAQTHLAEGNRDEAVRWFTRAASAPSGSPIAAQARAALSALATR